MSFQAILELEAAKAGFKLSTLQLQQFTNYYDLLIETNKHFNLTALTEPQDVAVKHFIDCLLAYDSVLFQQKTLLDVGSGAGFPGLPLKIYAPDLQVVLLDSLAKRVNFLNTVITSLQLSQVKALHGRAEDAGRDPALREHFDLVTARAVARLSVLAEYCLPFVKVGGYFLALKGSKYREEIADAKKALAVLGAKLISAKEVQLPGLNDGRALVLIQKLKSTPDRFPRKAGLPEKKPIV